MVLQHVSVRPYRGAVRLLCAACSASRVVAGKIKNGERVRAFRLQHATCQRPSHVAVQP